MTTMETAVHAQAPGAPTTTSVANLVDDRWTISNAREGVTTTGIWLDVALKEHTAELAARTPAQLHVRYQLGGTDIDNDVEEVRSVMRWLHEAYREAKTRDVVTRPQRYALLQRLAENRAMPSEMAVMLEVEVSVAERFAGTDVEARIARPILHQIAPPAERPTHD